MLDTTYFLLASIVRAKRFIQSGIAPTHAGSPHLHHFVCHSAEEECIGPVEVLDRVTMQVFVRDHYTVIATPVHCDVDGIPERSHYVRVSPNSGFQWLDPNCGPVTQYLCHAFHQLVRVVPDADHGVGSRLMRLDQHGVERLLARSFSEFRK